MTKEELEQKMRQALTKSGKTDRIDEVIAIVLSMSFLDSDKNRLIFFKQWEDKL